MSEGAAEHRRMRLDVYLHLAGEDRAYLAGLLLGVESRRGVATPTRGRGLSTFIKAFCVAALVAVVAGASYRAGAVGNASRIIATEAGSARNLLPNPESSVRSRGNPGCLCKGLETAAGDNPAPRRASVG